MAYIPPIFASSTFSFPDISRSDKSLQSQLSTTPTSTSVDKVTNGPPHTSLASTNQTLPLCPKEPQISTAAEPSKVCREKLRDSGNTTTTQYAMPPAPVPVPGHVSLQTTNLPRHLPASASLSPNSIASSNGLHQCFGPSSSGCSPATTISPADSQVPDWVAQHLVVAPSAPPGDINHRPVSTSRVVENHGYDGNVTGLKVAHSDRARSRKRRSDETFGGQPTRKRRSGECPHCNQKLSRLDQHYLRNTHYKRCPKYPGQPELLHNKEARDEKASASDRFTTTPLAAAGNQFQTSAHPYLPSISPVRVPLLSSGGSQHVPSSHTEAPSVTEALLVFGSGVVGQDEWYALSAIRTASQTRDLRYLIPFGHLHSVQRFAQGMLAEDQWRETSLRLQQPAVVTHNSSITPPSIFTLNYPWHQQDVQI